MVGDAGHAIFSRPAPSAQPPQVTARPGMFGPVQRNQFVAAPPRQITAGPLAAPVVKAPLVNTRTFQPATTNPVVKGLVSGEKTFATGVARILPGGTADLQAQDKAAKQNQINLIRAHSLKTAGKITPEQFTKLANVNASQANATSADVNSTIKAMPSKKGLALAAGETLLDATSGGSLQGAKAAYKAAKLVSATKNAAPEVKAAAKVILKEAVTKPTVSRKGLTLTHYTSPENAQAIREGGFKINKSKSVQGDGAYFFNGDKQVLSNKDLAGNGEKVTAKLTEDAKLLDVSKPGYKGPSPTSGNKLKKYALENGYHGVTDGAQTAIYDTSKLVVDGATKTQKAEKVIRDSFKANGFKLDKNASPEDLKILDHLTSTSNQLDKYYTGFGKMINQRREIGELGTAGAKANLKLSNKLKGEEERNWVAVLEGKEKAMNPKVAAAAKEARKELDAVHYRARAVGVKVAGRRANYFPHIHDPKIFRIGSAEREDAISHLVRTGQAKDERAASKILRNLKDARTLSPYENLSKHRALDLPGYAMNKEALHQYLDRSYASIAHTKVFGRDERHLDDILKTIGKNGGDKAREDATKLYRVASGLERGTAGGRRVANFLTTYNGATKLGLSTPLNATQNINTAAKYGIGNTSRAMVKRTVSRFKDNADRDFLNRTGVGSEQTTHEQVHGATGVMDRTLPGTNISLQHLFAPGFQAVERFNRETAALAARDTANNLARKAAGGNQRAVQKLFEDYGVKVGKNGELSHVDQLKAARVGVAETQFRTAAQDLPPFASSNWGRVLTQFKRYPYKQSEFIWNEVLKPAAHGNLLPLIRMTALGGTVGLLTNEALQKIRGNSFDESLPQKVLDMASTAAGGELISGTLNQLYPNVKDASSYGKKVVKTLGGPSVSNAIGNVEGTFNAIHGAVTHNATELKNAARQGIKQIPDVGTLSNRIVPYPDKQGSTPGKTIAGTDKFDPKQAFNTPEGKAFMKLSDADKKIAAASDPAARDLYDQYQAVKKGNGAKKLYSLDLSSESHKTLDRMDHLTTAGRAKVLDREKDAEYKIAVAQYEDNTLNGRLTPTQDIEAQDALAKKFVGSHYDKNTRDIYTLAQKDLKRYIAEHPDQADALLAYDKELYDNGLIASLKFKNGIGGGSGGSKKGAGNPYKYVAKKQGGVKLGGVAYKDTSHKFTVSRKSVSAGKPKMSITKSKV